MANQKKSNNLLQFALIFAAVYFGSQLILSWAFPTQFGNKPPAEGIVLKPVTASLRSGNDEVIQVQNNTDKSLQALDRCPMPPFQVYRLDPAGLSGGMLLTTTETAIPCTDTPKILPHTTAQVSLAPWKYSLFNTAGTYRLTASFLASSGATIQSATGAITTEKVTTQFSVHEPGVFVKLFRTFITKPFLNFLIFAGSIVPYHNLAIAIIILTLVVKLILFIPTQHALKGQREMQKIQPLMEEVKRKYKSDPQKVQAETMKIWKEHKVNPFQSCLPTLVQFPVLIGLLYVVRDGTNLALSRYLMYPIYQNLDWQFQTTFLGLNLLKPDIFFLPIFLVVAQFIQMKLAFSIAERKKNKAGNIIDVPSVKELEKEVKDAPKDPESAQKLQQNMMLYGLPLMIGFMALRFPAAVSIYWGVSTLFGIGQQLVVNRKS